MLRKGGIIGLLVLAGLIFLTVWFFTDDWIENQLESSGTSIVGAKVEIDDLDMELFSLKLKWERLQVTNPDDTWKNSFETGICDFDLEFWPLLEGKVVIDNFQISGVETNTDRETDGKIDKPEPEETDSTGFIDHTVDFLDDKVEKKTGFDLSALKNKVNVDSIIAMLELQTPAKLDSLQKHFTKRYEYWNENISADKYEKKISDLKTQVKNISTTNFNSPQQVVTAISKVNSIKTDIETITNEINNIKDNAVNDINSVTVNVSDVDDWVKDDYERALSKAKLPVITPENIGIMLFGTKMIQDFKDYLFYAEKARSYSEQFKSDEPKEPEPPRFEGQDIEFYRAKSYPSFWLKNLLLSGRTQDSLALEGKATHISSNQKLTDNPTIIGAMAKTPTRKYDFNAELNYLDTIPKETFSLDLAGISLNNLNLADNKYLPKKLEKGNGTFDIDLKLEGNHVDGKIHFTADRVKFSQVTETGNKDIEEIINDIISGIDNINVVTKLYGTGSDLNFELSSNIDKLFASSLSRVFDKQLSKLKSRITSEIESRIEKPKKEVMSYINDKKELITAKIDELNSKKEELNSLLKEKEQELMKKKAELESGLGDKLKGIFE